MIEIANFIHDYAKCLNQGGYLVDTIVCGKNKYYQNNKYTYEISDRLPKVIQKIKYVRYIIAKFLFYLKSSIYFAWFLFKYDIFVFVWNRSFLPLHIDLFVLKLLGKKVIMLHCGDDTRFRSIHYHVGQLLGQNDALLNTEDSIKHKYLYTEGATFNNAFFFQKVCEWAHTIILSQRNLATFARYYFFSFFPTELLIRNYKQTNEKVRIIHAPTSAITKRTDVVLKAMDIVEKECAGQYIFELIQNKPNEYVIETLKNVDIVIDQSSDWIGKLGAEALSAGCVVIGGNNSGYETGAPSDSPVVSFIVDAQSLADRIIQLIYDKEYRQTLMNQSYDFWEKYYSFDSFNIWFTKIINGEIELVKFDKTYKSLLLSNAENKWQYNCIKYLY